MRGVFLLLLCVAVFSVSELASAQSNELALEVSPSFPEPMETFTVTLLGQNTNRSKIQWFVNGVEKQESQNETKLQLEAPALFETLKLIAHVTLQNGKTEDLSKEITANRLDLITTSDTLVPPFYQGRSLPSSGSTLHVTAFFFNKANRQTTEYSYLWKINGKTQNGGALKGENTIDFIPSFETEAAISVDVFLGNQLVWSENVLVPIVKPEVYFYEKNPLRGLSPVALFDPYFFVGDEVTLRAEGYFMNKELVGNSVLREWKIDGRSMKGNENQEEEITLQKQGSRGISRLEFHVRNLEQLLQGARGALNIKF